MNEPVLADGQVTLYHGDCLEILRAFPDDSVDSVVTDPPAGIGFMGKEWDDYRRARNAADAERDDVFGRTSRHGPEYARSPRAGFVDFLTPVMAECLRVLKPGGHALVWAIPRTSHWTATAIEDAGFEVRDVVTHHFGSGFPKSLDVSKAIDKAAGAEREVVGSKLGLPVYSLNPNPGAGVAMEGNADGSLRNPEAECAVTAPATDEAKQWQGWGTALKPASEHWILARKPLAEPTVAKQVLATGTGALNIDGCRVAVEADLPNYTVSQRQGNNEHIYGGGDAITFTRQNQQDRAEAGLNPHYSPSGRWPANLVLSHAEGCDGTCVKGCPVAELDQQSGDRRGFASQRDLKETPSAYFGADKHVGERQGFNDSGGASRFFYVAKASARERSAGLGVDRNKHPTVKPVALMRWLCRMITPSGGLVLDPFMGSGSTGVAAKQEGFSFIGIEQGEVETAKRRLAWTVHQPTLFE